MSKQTYLTGSIIALSLFFGNASATIQLSDRKKPPTKSEPKKNTAQLDTQLRALISQFGLTGDVEGQDTAPNISDPIPQLGMQLFFSKALGGEKSVACATCHHPKLGGGDRLSLSIGVNAIDADIIGPRRQAVNNEIDIPRNSPTIFNVGLAKKALFWDGRVEQVTREEDGNVRTFISTPDSGFGIADENAGSTLVEALSRFPVTSTQEMRGAAFSDASTTEEIRSHIAQRIGDYGSEEGGLATNDWLAAFRLAFDSEQSAESLITFDSIDFALGQYQASFVLVDSDWSRYVKGDKRALNPAQKRGAKLFFTQAAEGGAGCVNCHSGERFSNDGFFNLAFPQYGIGKDVNGADLGRALLDAQPQNQFAFRVPSLLNVGLTAPYGHAGVYDTLAQVVSHYVDPAKAIEAFFQRGGACGLKQFSLNENCDVLNNQARENSQLALTLLQSSPFVAAPLDMAQQKDLVAFLHALTDNCTKDSRCLQKWIPNRRTVDPDNLRLNVLNRHKG
ncbi:cytochrome-c peroxidase [Pseudoalteromonas sp. MMG013]|uniref:cytochrome-c peroxidase n=1 Tax=Pseudoalteromonas sp. MMG013 TaxID=2822687 RepID=UPI001B362700|nr:cytochrome c peroxidase [Pseudoalteromonas sp. MMG013]MBQ4863280.1 cytochrome-c peroxidase [Pseudoalteromonas sp. MMG013]